MPLKDSLRARKSQRLALVVRPSVAGLAAGMLKRRLYFGAEFPPSRDMEDSDYG